MYFEAAARWRYEKRQTKHTVTLILKSREFCSLFSSELIHKHLFMVQRHDCSSFDFYSDFTQYVGAKTAASNPSCFSVQTK